MFPNLTNHRLTCNVMSAPFKSKVRECEQCNGKGGASLDPLLGFPVTPGACSRCRGTGKNWTLGRWKRREKTEA